MLELVFGGVAISAAPEVAGGTLRPWVTDKVLRGGATIRGVAAVPAGGTGGAGALKGAADDGGREGECAVSRDTPVLAASAASGRLLPGGLCSGSQAALAGWWTVEEDFPGRSIPGPRLQLELREAWAPGLAKGLMLTTAGWVAAAVSVPGQLPGGLGCREGTGCSCALATLQGAACSAVARAAGAREPGPEGKDLLGPAPLPEPAGSGAFAWVAAPWGSPDAVLPRSSPLPPPPGPGPGMVPTMEAAVAAMEAAASAAAAARRALAIWALALMSARVLAPVLLGLMMVRGKLGPGETWLVGNGNGDPWILETGIWKKNREAHQSSGRGSSHPCSRSGPLLSSRTNRLPLKLGFAGSYPPLRSQASF